MSWDGFLGEGLTCKDCGGPLSGKDGPRPAESYAGTFTGQCYRCQNGSAFVVATADDGCQTWSYPPHCPSWRRDRETFYGYADCRKCGGAGRRMSSRALSSGGSFPRDCEVCRARRWPVDPCEGLTGGAREEMLYTLAMGRLPVNRYTRDESPEACAQWSYTGKGKRKDPGLVARLARLTTTTEAPIAIAA